MATGRACPVHERLEMLRRDLSARYSRSGKPSEDVFGLSADKGRGIRLVPDKRWHSKVERQRGQIGDQIGVRAAGQNSRPTVANLFNSVSRWMIGPSEVRAQFEGMVRYRHRRALGRLR